MGLVYCEWFRLWGNVSQSASRPSNIFPASLTCNPEMHIEEIMLFFASWCLALLMVVSGIGVFKCNVYFIESKSVNWIRMIILHGQLSKGTHWAVRAKIKHYTPIIFESANSRTPFTCIVDHFTLFSIITGKFWQKKYIIVTFSGCMKQ